MTASKPTARRRRGRPRHRRTVEIVGLDHIQLSMPRGEEALARLFYGGVLGLQEVRKPPELRGRGGAWFVGPGVSLHLGVEEPFRPAARAHPAFLVQNLDWARGRLAANAVEIVEDDSGLAVRRCYVADPFGNRIALVDARDATSPAGRPDARSLAVGKSGS